VQSITAVYLPDSISVLLIIHEVIYNDTSNHSLFSEFYLRNFGIKVDSICHKHGDTQKMVIQADTDQLITLLELTGCMIHF
jgi:hypothetical protein